MEFPSSSLFNLNCNEKSCYLHLLLETRRIQAIQFCGILLGYYLCSDFRQFRRPLSGGRVGSAKCLYLITKIPADPRGLHWKISARDLVSSPVGSESAPVTLLLSLHHLAYSTMSQDACLSST